MVRTPSFHCRGQEFDPWSGTKILHAGQRGQKKKKKKPESIELLKKKKEKGNKTAYRGEFLPFWLYMKIMGFVELNLSK